MAASDMLATLPGSPFHPAELQMQGSLLIIMGIRIGIRKHQQDHE
jgi:hypothetical protein